MKNILFIVSLILVIACGNENEEVSANTAQQESPDSLFQQVMEEHNVAMAKVKKVRGYRAQADKKIDSLKKVKKPIILLYFKVSTTCQIYQPISPHRGYNISPFHCSNK